MENKTQRNILLIADTVSSLKCEQFYYQYWEKVKISGVVCNDLEKCEGGGITVQDFHDIPLFSRKVQTFNKETFYIIIDRYEENRSILAKNGLQEFDDYINAEWFGKRLAIIHGNCHVGIIREYLENVQDFRKRYFFYDVPEVHANEEGEIDEQALDRCELFLYQHIYTEEYGVKLTDKYILPRLPKKCTALAVPNLFALCCMFLPENTRNIYNYLLEGKEMQGIFRRVPRYICEALGNGQEANQIIEDVTAGKTYSEEVMQNNFNRSVDEITEKEKTWDIKISDYILDNYKKERLFYDAGHPANSVLKEISFRILKKLGIAYNENDKMKEVSQNLGQYEEMIMPCVGEYFHLEWDYKVVRRGKDAKKLNDNDMDIREYITQIAYWHCYSKDRIIKENTALLKKLTDENRKIILFGAGNMLQNYLQYYSESGSPALIVDNDERKWRMKISGIQVQSPQEIIKIPIQNRAVIICNIYYDEITEQLERMGVKEYYKYKDNWYIEKGQ